MHLAAETLAFNGFALSNSLMPFSCLLTHADKDAIFGPDAYQQPGKQNRARVARRYCYYYYYYYKLIIIMNIIIMIRILLLIIIIIIILIIIRMMT